MLLLEEIQFLSSNFPYLSHAQVFSCEISLVYHLKYQLLFFHFLFSGYCSFLYPCVCAISGRCNQSFFGLFYVVIESSYRCINAFFNVGESSSFFFLDTYSLSMSSLTCKALCIVMSFLVLWSICFSSSLVHFKNDPENSPSVYPLDEVSAILLGFT